MGRRISKEFLHPSILEGVDNKIGNLDSLDTDAKGNMVQAINELADKIDTEIVEGKELIASAIGEPLNVEDTFNAMSDKINDIKSDLKQVLTDEGVNVTEEDDIASLIGKVDEEFTEKNNELSGINNSYTLLKNALTSRDISVPNGATFDDMVALVNEKLSWTRVSAGSGSTYYTKQVGDIYLGSNGQVRDLGTITLSSTSVPKDKYISSLQISFPIYVSTDMPSVLIYVDAKVISSDGTVKYTGSASKYATDSGTTNTLSVIVRNIDVNTDRIQITAHGSTSDIYGRTVKAGKLSLQGTLITN
jgi:hypothetical protein